MESSKDHKKIKYSLSSIKEAAKLKQSASIISLDTDAEFIDQTKKSVAINLKIFLNYVQMIAIISLFELKWPYRVKDIIETQASISSLSNQILSIDCLLESKNENK